MEDTGNSKQPEVPDGAVRMRVRQHVETAHHHEEWNVLKVIQVIAGKVKIKFQSLDQADLEVKSWMCKGCIIIKEYQEYGAVYDTQTQ